ncbi:2-phosphosulfolactate phosphatase [Chengkuizengella axinellae]|uniref:Probable 2-phosphosulfolactate phosphatase n=1 Tax=Chengkuizengella axinellae TaxID=3064388 RepID=A0ABT9IX90_9BACL|nr:2-phosphosulfolactate phosphatase [Chengkuizengella sp. 2205SS18-9]MDP5273981.1 2-phosphosulfolactate phosphatase [Chengkuizengella sp. 2205SS18-9]
MKINILQLIEGAQQAKGLTVIIDVFRAFSTSCYLFENGAKTIIPVASLDAAYQLKKNNSDYILFGERGGIIQPGFDYGNSPSHIQNERFEDRTIVLTTSAGTQGIIHATNAEEIITGSFVNAGAISTYIKKRKPKEVSLVCMGWGGKEEADEDSLCAQYIKNELEGRNNDFKQIKQFLKWESQTGSFMDLNEERSAPKSDFDYCLDVNRFQFVLKVESYTDQFKQLRRIDVDFY